MDIKDLFEVEPVNWFIILLICVATLFSGLLAIAIWNIDFFLSMETVKLILLSLSLTFPVWIFNSFVADLLGEKKNCPKGEDNIVISSIKGAIINIISIYMSIIIFSISNNYKMTIVAFILLDFMLLVLFTRDK